MLPINCSAADLSAAFLPRLVAYMDHLLSVLQQGYPYTDGTAAKLVRLDMNRLWPLIPVLMAGFLLHTDPFSVFSMTCYYALDWNLPSVQMLARIEHQSSTMCSPAPLCGFVSSNLDQVALCIAISYCILKSLSAENYASSA